LSPFLCLFLQEKMTSTSETEMLKELVASTTEDLEQHDENMKTFMHYAKIIDHLQKENNDKLNSMYTALGLQQQPQQPPQLPPPPLPTTQHE